MRLSPLKKLRLWLAQNLPPYFSARVLGVATPYRHSKGQPISYLNRYGVGAPPGQSSEELHAQRLNLLKTAKEFPLFPTIKSAPKVFSLARYGDNNYWHWILEYLPALIEWDGRMPIFTAQNKKFHRETLGYLGIPPKLIIDSYAVGYVATPEVVFPKFDVTFTAAKLAFWQSRIKKPSSPGWGKVYISRARAGSRRIANEAELLPVLARHGYRVLHMEELTFAQQVELFQTADRLVAPHGAALSNLVFCQPQSRLLEILSPDMQPEIAITTAISQQIGFEHQFFWAQPTLPSRSNQGDLRVDISALEKRLRDLII